MMNDNYDYLEEILHKAGAELRLNNYALCWDKLSNWWTILNLSGEIEEIYKEDIDLKNALEYMENEN